MSTLAFALESRLNPITVGNGGKSIETKKKRWMEKCERRRREERKQYTPADEMCQRQRAVATVQLYDNPRVMRTDEMEKGKKRKKEDCFSEVTG